MLDKASHNIFENLESTRKSGKSLRGAKKVKTKKRIDKENKSPVMDVRKVTKTPILT